jgi:trk system potassium uptake protein TrkA
MNVVIVGGGRTGTHLATLLVAQKHHVRLVENRPEWLETARRKLPAEVVTVGGTSDPAALEAAGMGEAEVAAAVTAEDAENLVVASLAKFQFKVRRVISRINNPRHAWLFTHDFGVDVALNQADVMARLIEEEMSLGDMMMMLKLRRGEYSLVEEKLVANSAMLAAPLKDLPLPAECVIAAVIRQGQVQIPRGNMMFQVNDEVLALVSNASLAELKKMLGRP